MFKSVSKLLFNQAIRKSKSFKNLPYGYGKDQNERCIEIEFVRHYYQGEKAVLDVGYTHAEPAWFDMINSLYIPELTGIDISKKNTPPNYHKTIKGDIRQTIFKNNSFDSIFCISTLEHIGMNNKIYGQKSENNADSQLKAMKEMYRILKPGGELFLTLPFGKFSDHNWFIQYDLASLGHIIIQPNFKTKKFQTYIYEKHWRFCKASDCARVKYLEKKHQARAVVCLLLTK